MSAFSLPTIPMPAVSLNVDMRNMRWSWPGYLTFGKNSKDKEKRKNAKGPLDQQKHDPKLEPKPDTGGEGGAPSDTPVAEGDIPNSEPPKETEKVEVEVEVDTVSLADAMEESGPGGSSNAHSPGPGTPNEAPPPPAVGSVEPTPDENPPPAAVQLTDPVPVFREGVDEVSEEPDSISPPLSSPEEPPPIILEPPPLLVEFSQTSVYLAPPGHPLQTTKRRLFYLTVSNVLCRLSFRV